MSHFEYVRENARRCPQCGGKALNVQGVADCPNCTWADAAPVGTRT